jgi:hypothetical protein
MLKGFKTRVSGAQMELFDEKTRGQKSCDRVPLKENKPDPALSRSSYLFK